MPYSLILQAITQQQSLRHRYKRLNVAFHQCLESSLPTGGLRFGGTFAQTEYLLRQHRAMPTLARDIHGARKRMAAYGGAPTAVLQENFDTDVLALTRFLRLVTGQEPPPQLRSYLTAITTKEQGGGGPSPKENADTQFLADCLRLCVLRVEPPYVIGHADGFGDAELRLWLPASDVAAYPEWDWSYVADLAVEGTQLNIVRPRRRGDVIYPELVIVEPDYLVDVTAVASCFEEYGHSPVIHLISRFQPHPATQAILLGNLAGQLLDEQLTLPPSERDYSKSVRRFFQANAVALATTPLSPTFHDEARAQQQNISRAIRDGLQAHVQGFDSTKVALEPSFYSEMLGLQGRMDFLSMDFSLLIEQKSGRCGFPQRDPATPVQATKHYVQMLLYMLLLRYNFRERTAQSGHRLLAFLLYSKYPNSLLAMGFAPKLVAEAVRIRNELAAAQLRYAHEGFAFLTSLTADGLNTTHVHSRLWTAYQRPQLEAVLAPIREASPVEKAYFLRFLAFEHTEHLLSKVGNRTSTSHGFAEKWHSTLAEKLDAGSIAAPMELLPPPAHERILQLTFRLPPLPDDAAFDFRRGDIVIVYPYLEGAEPDARRTIVFRATIVSLSTEEVTLRLRSPQSDATLFTSLTPQPSPSTSSPSPSSPPYPSECPVSGGTSASPSSPSPLWAMEHDFMEASFSTIYRGLHAMLSAPAHRRQLLFLQRPPLVDASLLLRGDYGAFNDLALRVHQAQELFLIIGPPGTGKTSFGLMTTLQETLLTPSSSALLVAFTNRAVDEICCKLHETGIDFLRLGASATAEDWLRPYLLDSRVANASNVDAVRQILLTTRVVVATTSAIAAQPAILAMRSFDVAIVDEASQILEPQILPLWCATTGGGEPSVKKFVLIGDHCQLAAVVQQQPELSKVTDPVLHGILLRDCRDSLFERLLRRYRHDPAVTFMLTRQGRMHPAIADFPSRAFYKGCLQPVPLPHQLRDLPPDLPSRVQFINVDPAASSSGHVGPIADDATPVQFGEKVNQAEAEVIARLAHEAWHSSSTFDPATSLGIIVPYRNQIAAIRRRIAAYGIAELDTIAIDTVERYQGSQRDTIIYGFTVSLPYQLNFLASTTFEDEGQTIDRKLNVAMTRARERLILVGNEQLLRQLPVCARLLDAVSR